MNDHKILRKNKSQILPPSAGRRDNIFLQNSKVVGGSISEKKFHPIFLHRTVFFCLSAIIVLQHDFYFANFSKSKYTEQKRIEIYYIKKPI